MPTRRPLLQEDEERRAAAFEAKQRAKAEAAARAKAEAAEALARAEREREEAEAQRIKMVNRPQIPTVRAPLTGGQAEEAERRKQQAIAGMSMPPFAPLPPLPRPLPNAPLQPPDSAACTSRIWSR